MEICMSQDEAQRSAFSPGQDWMCLCVVAQEPNLGDASTFNLCLQVGLTQTGDKTPQTWRIVHFNSHFHLSGLWEHKQSHSAVTQLLSCTNPGPWSSAGFVAAKNVADIAPTSAGLKPSLDSSALLPAFPLSWSYTRGVWGAPGPSNPPRAALGGVHGHEHHEWPKSCIIYWIHPPHSGFLQTHTTSRRCLVWLLEKQNQTHRFL